MNVPVLPTPALDSERIVKTIQTVKHKGCINSYYEESINCQRTQLEMCCAALQFIVTRMTTSWDVAEGKAFYYFFPTRIGILLTHETETMVTACSCILL